MCLSTQANSEIFAFGKSEIIHCVNSEIKISEPSSSLILVKDKNLIFNCHSERSNLPD